MTVIERIDALEERFVESQHADDAQLRADLSEMRAAIEAARSGQEEPVRVVTALSRLKRALAGFRAALERLGDADLELIAFAHEAETVVAREVAARSAVIWSYVAEKLRGDTRTYVREIADRSYLGPPLFNDELVRLHVKTRSTSGTTGGIDDLVATCGIWICNPFGDTCLCTEWECSGDGPSGSFP